MSISKRIKEIREEKGLRQVDVADKIGLESPNYSRLEKRGKKLTLEQLESIAHALGVSIKDILFPEILIHQDSADFQRELEIVKRENTLLENEKQFILEKNAYFLQKLAEQFPEVKEEIDKFLEGQG